MDKHTNKTPRISPLAIVILVFIALWLLINPFNRFSGEREEPRAVTARGIWLPMSKTP